MKNLGGLPYASVRINHVVNDDEIPGSLCRFYQRLARSTAEIPHPPRQFASEYGRECRTVPEDAPGKRGQMRPAIFIETYRYLKLLPNGNHIGVRQRKYGQSRGCTCSDFDFQIRFSKILRE